MRGKSRKFLFLISRRIGPLCRVPAAALADCLKAEESPPFVALKNAKRAGVSGQSEEALRLNYPPALSSSLKRTDESEKIGGACLRRAHRQRRAAPGTPPSVRNAAHTSFSAAPEQRTRRLCRNDVHSSLRWRREQGNRPEMPQTGLFFRPPVENKAAGENVKRAGLFGSLAIAGLLRPVNRVFCLAGTSLPNDSH